MMNENFENTKFCLECGAKINRNAVICPHCGCQVDNTIQNQPQIVINNSNQNQNQNNNMVSNNQGRVLCNKWVSILLCIFLGWLGGHKYYERKIGTGIVYTCTFGFLFIGVIIDFLNLLAKPNPYYVR